MPSITPVISHYQRLIPSSPAACGHIARLRPVYTCAVQSNADARYFGAPLRRISRTGPPAIPSPASLTGRVVPEVGEGGPGCATRPMSRRRELTVGGWGAILWEPEKNSKIAMGQGPRLLDCELIEILIRVQRRNLLDGESKPGVACSLSAGRPHGGARHPARSPRAIRHPPQRQVPGAMSSPPGRPRRVTRAEHRA
jgi:hypothetical protein